MARDFAKGLYSSLAWQQVSAYYMSSKNYICERCGKPAKICHHKTWLTPSNISNTSISLNPDNLECLCQECHNIEHMRSDAAIYFDDNGNVRAIKESTTIQEHKAAADLIDDTLEKARALLSVVSCDDKTQG